MLSKIIKFSIKNKLVVFLFTAFIVGFGIYSLTQIPIGAVPDITNNQVQVITTSKNLSTQDIEQFISYPVELEMANIPGVVEIRSTSKFGLSVVTIVFEESMGTYLPRQLIAEKLIAVRESIPEKFGIPEMGPITTGLGEIYQYILDVEPEYKDQYDVTKLRTIQDWIIKRQLSGIKGVVEVSTWGGFLKQYEVAINTTKLNAMDIKVTDILTALEKNNSIAGGGYIEKTNQSYFIRGDGLMTSLDDIKQTVVVNRNGLPILIRDIANVAFGSATRFGAITANGEGEKVLGQVMMVKDGNPKQVIEAVKERMKSIQKSLPKGVYINSFLDRSELITKTTNTVYENLILGSLIVIFIVVILLGNWRSGLVITSIIPLSLLFLLGMMNLFGIDANLMSLGAIDFGIIIDGSVIIVEFIAFKIATNHAMFTNLNKEQSQELRDDITAKSASKMMSSAIFGQIIILVVFIPILTLGGIEGKMFKPMAMTFGFALIGAMILGLTFVPAIASLVIKPSKLSDKNISVRLMRFFTKTYEPIIRWSLKSKRLMISLSLLILAFSFYIFTTLGSEFIPTLDEGDFALHPSSKTGTSLSKTVESMTKIENVLKNKFPEIEQVVCKIGAAEVPTDPMSMEQADVIVTLKDKSEWTSAKTKDELADKFKEALKVIPNMEFEFLQPIEMRFNELISGVRSDIAIKIYGEDLDVLSKKANEIKRAVQNIKGVADIAVEKTAGLPQMNIKFNRNKIARYGLNISDINDIIAMGFSGKIAGSIFEGEKKFDLVLRLDKKKRKDISDLKDLFVDLPNGGKIPLSEVANITYKKGAAMISRDDAKRRVVVGINVRNSDLQTVVDNLKEVIDKKIEIPVGYTITYGGQFENLESAKKRLKVAVPIALILIFILLFLAFKSVKDVLIIYTAIPFAAVGGILSLWLLGMPFSISAGIGFIALFGVAVLNGIVLIEEFRTLKKNGESADDNLITKGTKNRLRAVLLTALSTAFGFLPMAISTGAGAEVQRPLATVVIGGLVTSTILTLFVLPVLYSMFHTKKSNFKFGKKAITIIVLLVTFGLQAQNNPLSLVDLKQEAYKNNLELKALSLQINQKELLANAPSSLGKTQVFYNYENDKISESIGVLSTYGIAQRFNLPSVYKANKNLRKSTITIAQANFEIKKQVINKKLELAYQHYLYVNEKVHVYQKLDSLYSKFTHNSNRKFELGESNYLEKITAKSKYRQIQIQYNQATNEVEIAKIKIKQIVQIDEGFSIKKESFDIKIHKDITIENNKGLDWFAAQEQYLNAKTKSNKKEVLPDFSLQYSYGDNSFYSGSIQSFQIGMQIPLFRKSLKSKINASKIDTEINKQTLENYRQNLISKQKQLLLEKIKYQESLDYYKTEGETLSKAIVKTAERSFKEGEIDFFQYIQSIKNAYDIKLSYLESLYQYNQIIIKINNLTI